VEGKGREEEEEEGGRKGRERAREGKRGHKQLRLFTYVRAYLQGSVCTWTYRGSEERGAGQEQGGASELHGC
jgi:hypothetical protein